MTRVRKTPCHLDNFRTAAFKDPVTIEEDLDSSHKKKCQKEIKEELKSIEYSGSWTKTALPPGKNAIACRTVFERMLDNKGNVYRFKACLVVKKFFQKECVDYS